MLSGVADRLGDSVTGAGKIDLIGLYQHDPVGFAEKELRVTLTDEIREAMLSVDRETITLLQSGNATGKTHGCGIISIWWLLCKPQPQVYTAAAPPESNLRNLLWGEIDDWVIRRPDLFEGCDHTTMSIKRRPKEFIKGVLIPVSGNPADREARFSGKHAPHLLFVIDEGDAVPDEVYRGIESCMSGGVARLVVPFNPRKPSGRIYELQKRKLTNVIKIPAITHINVRTGKDIIPGAVTQETTLRRIHEWTRPLYDNEAITKTECFQVPDYLAGIELQIGDHTFEPLPEGQWRKIVNPAFSYMVMARYPASLDNQLIHPDWIDQAVERWKLHAQRHGEKPLEPMCIMGQDIADVGQDWNVCYYRYGNWVGRPDRWQGVDAFESARIGAAHAKRKGAHLVFSDGTGVGGPVAAQQRKLGLRAYSVKANAKPTSSVEWGQFKNLRDQCCWAMREWFRSDEAMIPPIDRLIEELKVAIYDNSRGYIEVSSSQDIKDVIKRSPDDFTALYLTFGPRRKNNRQLATSTAVPRTPSWAR